MKTRNDKIAIGLIWLFVVGGASLVGGNSNDASGVGALALGISLALTGVYRYLRWLRTSDRFIRVNKAGIGKPTTASLTAVLVIVLWIIGSVLLILARVPDGYAVVLGWLLPITVYLIHRFRVPRTGCSQ
jgi:hypothetical protein